MPNYYGIATKKEIALFTGEVCEFFDGQMRAGDHYNPKYLNAYNLMMETIATETLMGEMPDTDNDNGMGLTQLDYIRWQDIMKYSIKHRQAVLAKWNIDILLIDFNALRYDWKSSIILSRLAYKRISGPIPSTREERAKYWKKYWNTYKGAGTENQYMERSQRFLGNE